MGHANGWLHHHIVVEGRRKVSDEPLGSVRGADADQGATREASAADHGSFTGAGRLCLAFRFRCSSPGHEGRGGALGGVVSSKPRREGEGRRADLRRPGQIAAGPGKVDAAREMKTQPFLKESLEGEAW